MVGVQRVQVDVQAGQDLVKLIPVMDAGIDFPSLAVGPVGRHRQHEHFAARHEVDGQVHFLDAHARIAAAQQQDGVVVPGVPFDHGRVVWPVVDVEPRFRKRPNHPGVHFRIGHGVVDDEQAGIAVRPGGRLLPRACGEIRRQEENQADNQFDSHGIRIRGDDIGRLIIL